MDEFVEDNIEELKKKLKNYKKDEIKFNEPHFTQQLISREGNREDIINHILNPEKLVYSYQEEGKYGDIKHNLHFAISENRTMRLPIIFDKDSKKSLYIITYIMRYRKWQNMLKKAGFKHG